MKMNSNVVAMIALAIAASISLDCSARYKSVDDVKADVDQDIAYTASAGKRADARAVAKGKKRIADAKSNEAKNVANEQSDNARDAANQAADEAQSGDQRTYSQQFQDWKNNNNQDKNMDDRTTREKFSDFFHGRN